MKGTTFSANHYFEVLTDGQIEQIHEATLGVLAKVGVSVKNESALALMARAGAEVDGNVVHFPREMVKELLPQAPSKVTLHARNAEKSVELGRDKVHCTNGYGTVQIIDLDGQVHRTGLKDLRDSIIIADSLDNVHSLLCQCFAQDVPEPLGDLLQAREMVINSDKHQGLTVIDASHLDYVFEIGDLAGSRLPPEQKPVYSLGLTSISPLQYSTEGAERLMKLAERNVPIRVVCGAIAGATSPVTLAGTLVVQNAEVLAGILMAQVFNPGAPVLYGTFASPMNLVSGNQLWGVPEMAILNAATAQLCRFYKLPFGYGSAGSADSAESDIQAGIEKTLTLALTAAAGVDVIHNAVSGLLGTSTITSLAQMVIDNEIINTIFRAIRGIEVNVDTLAEEVIQTVGPGGNYLAQPHTVSFMREELWLTGLFDRRSIEDRRQGPGGDLLDKAAAEAKQILVNHQPFRLDDEVEREMERVIRRAATEAGVKLDESLFRD